MAKSFKKVIACLLAVLMVCFSMPFTALAAPGDYEPDIKLQFGTFHTNNDTSWYSYVDTTPGKTSIATSYYGLYDVPLDYNYTKNADGSVSGKLVLDSAKATLANELDCYDVDTSEDIEYTVGDYFTVTFLLDNVEKLAVLSADVTYSDNIEPAGLYTYKVTSGRTTTTYYGLGSVSDVEAIDGATFTLGGPADVVEQSSQSFYDSGLNCGPLGDGSEFDTETRSIHLSQVATNGYYSTTTWTDDFFADPNTGDLSTGYTYENCAILHTYIFKIVDEGDITFGMTNPTERNSGFYIADGNDGTTVDLYTTYSTQEGCAGSNKLTFMGMNVNTGVGIPTDEPATHEHTYSSVTTDPTCTEDGYITFTCDNSDGLGAVGDHVYTEGADLHPELAKTGHTPGEAVVESFVDSTCEVEGSYDEVVYCTVCGEELSRETKTVALKDHTPGEAVVENVVEATEETEGSYDEVVYCSVCGEELSREAKTIPALDHVHSYTETIVEPTCTEEGYTLHTCVKGDDEYKDNFVPATGHTPGEAVEENYIDSTCTARGSYDSVVYCSVCGEELSRETKTVDFKPHIPAEAVRENEIAPTCELDGEYDEVVYCDVCGTELSRTITPVPATNHRWELTSEKVEATAREDGHEAVYTCANDPSHVMGGDVIPATGIIVTIDSTYENYGDVNVAYGENSYKYLSTVELTATPVEGARFVGWEVSGKKVSEDLTFTFVATSDVTVKPIFADSESAITVVFLDMYNNVSYSYVGDVAGFAAAMEAGIPEGTNYPGYTFSGWTLTDDEIKAITESTTISSNYDSTGNQYTVTLDGAGTIDGEAVSTKNVSYDAKVTVKSEGATSWTVNGATVAYGDTYTFFVGADITVTPVTDDTVIAKPEIAMVKATVSDASNKKVNYLATMSITDGYKLLDHGFVYVANNVDASALTVDAAGTVTDNGKTIKKVTGGATGSAQFALNYAVTTTQYATVVAYIVYQAADGTVTYEYSTPTVFDYSTIA